MWYFFHVLCVDFLQSLGTCSLKLAEIKPSHLYLGIRVCVEIIQLVAISDHVQT